MHVHIRDQRGDERYARPTIKQIDTTVNALTTINLNDGQATEAPANGVPPVTTPDPAQTGVFAPTSHWTVADATKIKLDDLTTTIPKISDGFPVIDPDRFMWDSWAIRDVYGRTIEYKGWKILIALVADRPADNSQIVESWHSRNDRAYIGYYYSRSGDTNDWKFGGNVIKPGANKRDWEWSGCTIIREGTPNILDLFFTSVNGAPAEAVAAHSVGTVNADENGVWLEGFDTVTDLFQADGIHYSSITENPFRDFRDPHVFIDPETDRLMVLFEGDMPGIRGELEIMPEMIGTLPPGNFEPGDGVYDAGCIGIGECVSDWKNGDYTKWRLFDPLISALPITGQTERPHVVFKDGLTYIFTICHHAFFGSNLKGADGVYGFVSRNGLKGPFEPLNSSGLVLANPSDAPFQTYSHFVYPQGYVIAFIDTVPQEGDPVSPSKFRIGGTQAPTLKLNLDGSRTYVEQVLDYGQIVAQRIWTEDTTPDKRPAGAVVTPAGIQGE